MNYGVDFSILNNRLSGTIEYYAAKTKDLLFKVSLPPTSGVTAYMANIGKSENKGFEIYNKIEQLNRAAALEAPPLPVLPEGYRIEKYHVGDWESRYTLMKNITPPEVQEYEPVHRKKYYKGMLDSNLL